MNQSISMVTRDTLRILDTKPYSNQKINILGTNASFNNNGNFAHYTLKSFSMFKNFQLCTCHLHFQLMNQTMYLATRDMLRILDTKRYSHKKVNILDKKTSFNIDENSAHYTFKYFSKAQEILALHMSFKSSKSSIKLCIRLSATR